jgi:hypothetical protein
MRIEFMIIAEATANEIILKIEILKEIQDPRMGSSLVTYFEEIACDYQRWL